VRDFAELEDYFATQNRSKWKVALSQSLGYDIRDEMKKQGISRLEMIGYFSRERGFTKEEILAVIDGQMLGRPSLYNKVAAALGLSFEELYTTTGLNRHGNVMYYPRAGEGSLDTMARERGRKFCENVGQLWAQQNPHNGSSETFYSRLGRSRHDFELIRKGKVPLDADMIRKAASACNTSNSPERVSMPTRGVSEYPKMTLREDGAVDSKALAYNLRMTMHIRLWEAGYFCDKTGRTSKNMFDLMAGTIQLSREDVCELIDRLGLLEYHLLGEVPDTDAVEEQTAIPGYSNADTDCDAIEHEDLFPEVDREAMRYQAAVVANIKTLLMKEGLARGGAEAERTLCGAWQRICPDIPLASLWGGGQSEELVFVKGQSEDLISNIAAHFGTTAEALGSVEGILVADVRKMRKEIFDAIEREENASRLRIMLEMAQEEGARVPM